MAEHYLKTRLRDLLQERPDVFDLLIDALTDGLWIWDLERPSEEYYSANLVELFGFDPDEVPHESHWWQSQISRADLELATSQAELHFADPLEPYDLPVRYTHKNGSAVWVRCRGVAIRNGSARPELFVGFHYDLTPIKHDAERFEELSVRDTLTGLLNRRGIEDALKRLRESVNGKGTNLYAGFMDLDNFKDINTAHGHDIGDLVLKETAIRIRGSLRLHDEVARIGGDEFMALIMARDKTTARAVLERLLQGLERPHQVGSHDIACTATAALVTVNAACSIDGLIECAAPVLIAAKQNGRRRVITESILPAMRESQEPG